MQAILCMYSGERLPVPQRVFLKTIPRTPLANTNIVSCFLEHFPALECLCLSGNKISQVRGIKIEMSLRLHLE